MFLYLMRHAEAEPVGGTIKKDADRPLTPYGRFQAQAVAKELKARNIEPKVVTSPLKRAFQTADILCQSLSLIPPHKEPLLTSSGKSPDLAALLRTHAGVENLLLLGHQPDIGLLVNQVLGFELGFSTATIAAFELLSSSSWRFSWTRTPEELLKAKGG